MPTELHVDEDKLREELERIGIDVESVSVDALATGGSTVMVRIVSPSFEGQTFLDRETRIRVAVTRYLVPLLPPGATVVLDPLTTEEATPEIITGEMPAFGPLIQEERVNRRRWQERARSVIAAVEHSGYDVDLVTEPNVYVATRTSGLSGKERIALAFAKSTASTTVDLETRGHLQELQASQSINRLYYITPTQLTRPWSNQKRLPNCYVESPESFCHALNSSSDLARRQLEEIQNDLSRVPPEQQGPTVEPDVRIDGELLSGGFFEYFDKWRLQEGPSILMLIAPGGHGKTTLATEFTNRLAHAALANNSAPVPLSVGFESVRRTVDFEALLHKRFAQLKSGAFGAFAELLRSNEALLVVDGFDELAEDAGGDVAEAQVRSMRPLLSGNAKVILAGRAVFTNEFARGQSIADRVRGLVGDVRVTVAEVLPFSIDQVGLYVKTRRNLSPASAESIVKFAESSPDHGELCGNPLFLRMLCSLAADKMLPENISDGVDTLIEQICLREEERHHLGLGVSGQRDFLEWVAGEIFRSHSGRNRNFLPSEEVKFMAKATLEHNKDNRPEIVGRLADHALFMSIDASGTTFIHPLIRDVLLSRSVMSVGGGSLLDIGDLPEGTVFRLGKVSRSGMALFERMGPGWLSAPAPRQADTSRKRNLIRIALSGSRFAHPDEPRRWYENHWLSEPATVRDADLSGLAISSASFRGLQMVSCTFESALFEDCTFEHTTFRNCDARFATMIDCQFDAATAFTAGQVSDVLLFINERPVAQIESETTFLEWIRATYAESPTRPPSQQRARPVSTRCRDLVRDILKKLIAVEDGAPQFHKRFWENFEHEVLALAEDEREKKALQRVIVPGVTSRLCNVERAARGGVTVDKRWHSATAAFVLHGQVSPALDEELARLASRSARYLE